MSTRSRFVALLALALPLTSASPAQARKKGGKPVVVQLAVTKNGFEPAQVMVKKGVPLTLVVTRKTDTTCATEIVIKDYGLRAALPLDKPVSLNLTPKAPGEIRYACAMDMISGVLTVE